MKHLHVLQQKNNIFHHNSIELTSLTSYREDLVSFKWKVTDSWQYIPGQGQARIPHYYME